MAKENNILMATHRNFFPVARMPWHSDGHQFGESSDQRGWKMGKAFRQEDIVEMLNDDLYPADHTIGPLDNTIYFADSGRCRVCKDYAVYVFKGKLYCSACWLAWDEDAHG